MIGKSLVCAVIVSAGVGLFHEARSDGASSFPPQLEMRVPFEPTAFPDGGRRYLAYELYLTNFAANPITLRRIEVLDSDKSDAMPIAAFEAGELDALLQPIGPQNPTNAPGDRRQLTGGGSVVVFLWITLDSGAQVPQHLQHRVFTADFTAQGALIGTHHTDLLVLGPAVRGAIWRATDGPGNDPDNHHRRGLFILDGRPGIDRRYAIDWEKLDKGSAVSGDPLDRRSYHAYGEAVLAVADAHVVSVKDGLPDNVPGHNESFHPAVPITLETVAGNTITLDLGSGQFAHYMHLQPGSLRVKPGDRIRRGALLARIGISGDAREPHLHLEVTTSPKLIAGEGVPYLVDHYRVKSANDTWQNRSRELPLDGMQLDFGEVAERR